MSFNQWIKLYKRAQFNETRIALLNHLEQGNVKETYEIPKSHIHFDLINNILTRKYKLAL
jgi:hypothetical protein